MRAEGVRRLLDNLIGEGEEFVMGHSAVHQKVKNIRRDPRVALSLLDDKANAQGLHEYFPQKNSESPLRPRAILLEKFSRSANSAQRSSY